METAGIPKTADAEVHEIDLEQPQSQALGMMPIVFMVAPFLLMLYMGCGVLGVAGCLGFWLVAGWSGVRRQRRLGSPRLQFDGERVQVGSVWKTWRRRPPDVFTWDEVLDVSWKRKFAPYHKFVMRLTLTRPQDRRVLPHQNMVVTLPEPAWQDAEFMAAMRRHVGERLVPGSLEPPKEAAKAYHTFPAASRALPDNAMSGKHVSKVMPIWTMCAFITWETPPCRSIIAA